MRKKKMILIFSILFFAAGLAIAQGHKKSADPPRQTPPTPHAKASDHTNQTTSHKKENGKESKEHENTRGEPEKEHRSNTHDTTTPHNEEKNTTKISYDSEYSFYGVVRWSGDTVIVGSRKLIGDNPWLTLLAPGMKIEVQGKIVGEAIRVKKIEVRYPHHWSFYTGPAKVIGLSGSWVKVWFVEEDRLRVFRQIAADHSGEILLAACYHDGEWQALPENIEAPATPSSPGRWLLKGKKISKADSLRWLPYKKLSGGCH